MSCISVLNDFLAYLPTVYDSSMAIEGTEKSTMSFNEAGLARIILNLVPVTGVNQYNMMHLILPKSPRALLPDHEAIKCIMNKKHQASLKAKAEEASLVPRAPKEVPRSILHLRILVNYKSQRRQGLQSSASTAITRATPI
jgi:hypothetical protein